MTQKLILETASNCVYFWTEELASKPGFVEYDPKPKTQAAPEPEPVVEPAPEPATEIQQMAATVLKKKRK